MNKVSVIIPVFNEERTLADVVQAVLDSGAGQEIICVNDGSTDKSREILESFGDKIKLINFAKNQGKGAAMAAGLRAASGNIILFLDSDHPNLESRHIKDLLDPVLSHKFRAAIGLAFSEDTPKLYKVLVGILIGLNVYTGGQRAYLKKDLETHVNEMERAGYGAELFLNTLIDSKKIDFVLLSGLRVINNNKKWPFRVALKKWFVFNLELARQSLRKLFK